MKSRKMALSMWRAADKDKNREPYYVYDEERDTSYCLNGPSESMQRYAERQLKRTSK